MSNMTLSHANHLLQHLVSAGGWHGSSAAILEGVPHLSDSLSGEDIVATLDNLEIPFTRLRCRQSAIEASDCPALFIGDDGECRAILDARDGEQLVLDPEADEPVWLGAKSLRGSLIKIERHSVSAQQKAPASVGAIIDTMRPVLPWLCLASLMTNLMGLATPLLVMVIYDRVIPAKATDMLLSLVVAVAIIALADSSFRYARTIAVAHLGRELERSLSIALFRKLMTLPLSQLQKNDVNQQIARFKQFESLRDIFTGQVMTTLLDTPFTPVYWAFLFVLAPPAAILILIAVGIYVIASFVSISIQQKRDALALSENARLRAHAHDALRHQKAIAELGLKDSWIARHSSLVERAETASREARYTQSINQSFAQSLMSFAGIGSIFYCTHAAMAGDMSFGALIAVIALVWKVLGPIQSLYGSLPQILAYRRSKQQADRVLSLPEEHRRGLGKSHGRKLGGHVALNAVTFRPDQARRPILSQVSLDIPQGESVLVLGSDASARSALLDLIAGLHIPTIGTIEHDDVDLRQIAVDDLRRSISYHIPDFEMFHGTVLQNFQLAAPSVSETAVLNLIGRLEVDLRDFPEGIHTRLTDAFKVGLPSETLPALSLARSMLRKAPIYLFDEPTARLNQSQRATFRTWLEEIKGTSTVLIATPDRSLLNQVDRYVYLDHGRIAVNDTGEAGLKKIKAMLTHSGGS